MNYRHEYKFEINYSDFLVLRQRLGAVMQPDSHTKDGVYKIRSLYFDNLSDKALREKVDGINRREKFRIRYYNKDTSFIRLEKKCKYNGLCVKESAPITVKESQELVEGRTDWMPKSPHPLIRELYGKMQYQGMRPKTIVDYTRIPYIFAPGNVRVTLDFDIRTGMDCINFLNTECITVPASDGRIILEVKWDEFLPGIIQDAVGLSGRRAAAFSKYEACRIYG
jgi:hypothetical protein